MLTLGTRHLFQGAVLINSLRSMVTMPAFEQRPPRKPDPEPNREMLSLPGVETFLPLRVWGVRPFTLPPVPFSSVLSVPSCTRWLFGLCFFLLATVVSSVYWWYTNEEEKPPMFETEVREVGQDDHGTKCYPQARTAPLL